MTEKKPSKKEKRQEAEKHLAEIESALEYAEKELAINKRRQKLVLDNYEPTVKAIEDAEMKFRAMSEFYEINKESQALTYEQENAKAEKRIEDLKELASEQKQIIRENRG